MGSIHIRTGDLDRRFDLQTAPPAQQSSRNQNAHQGLIVSRSSARFFHDRMAPSESALERANAAYVDEEFELALTLYTAVNLHGLADDALPHNILLHRRCRCLPRSAMHAMLLVKKHTLCMLMRLRWPFSTGDRSSARQRWPVLSPRTDAHKAGGLDVGRRGCRQGRADGATQRQGQLPEGVRGAFWDAGCCACFRLGRCSHSLMPLQTC